MADSSNASRVGLGPLTVFSVAAVVLGLAVFIVGMGLDWHGFWGGVGQGLGLGAAGMGLYLWGYANGLRRGGPRAAWRPSKDSSE